MSAHISEESDGASKRRFGALEPFLIVIASLLPLAWLIRAVFTYKITAPFREQWFFLYVVEKSWLGTLTFQDLWHQEAEHRHPFPYLIMLALAHLSHWNITWELATNIVIAVGSFLCLCVFAARVTGRKLNWLIPLLSVIVFSTSQFETWTWGFHIVTYLNLLAAIGGMVLLAHPSRAAWRYALGIALGVVACFSFATGFVYWISAGVIVWFQSPADSRRRRIVGWVIAAAVTTVVFFYGYRFPAWSAPVSGVLEAPFRFLEFLLVSLGTPLVPLRRIPAIVVGVLGLLLLVGLSIMVLRRGRSDLSRLSFCWGLALYAIGSAALISAGRANFGDALSGRYTTTTVLLWIANILLLYEVVWSPRAGLNGGRKLRLPLRILLLALTVCFVWQTVRGVKAFRWYYNRFKPAEIELYSLQNPERALPLFPPNPPIDEMVGKLRKYQWGIFRENMHEDGTTR